MPACGRRTPSQHFIDLCHGVFCKSPSYPIESMKMGPDTKGPLALSPLANFRDLGGTLVAGGTIAPSVVALADDISYVDEIGAQCIIEAETTLLLDLRSAGEIRYSGRGLLGPADITYLHQPIGGDPGTLGTHSVAEWGTGPPEAAHAVAGMAQWYVSLLENYSCSIWFGLEAIADTPGPTVVHCVSGKDRTGLFAASLLSLLGADDEVIVDNYVRSGAAMPEVMARIRPFVEGIYGSELEESIANGVLAQAPAAVMRAVLAEFHDRYGGLANRFKEHGVNDELIADLRRRLVVE